MENKSLLGFALLGLLQQAPMSGYDVRKVFESTAMGSFSDSPGAIYPALRRLEVRGLARSEVPESESLRKRRVFCSTPAGFAALKAWLIRPVTRDDVIRRIGDLMLRFAFMDQTLGEEQTSRFLDEFANQMANYIPALRQHLESHVGEMSLSGRLALEFGIQGYEAQLHWARTARTLYEQRKGNPA